MKKPIKFSKKEIEEAGSIIAGLEHPRGRSYNKQAEKLLCAGYRKVAKPIEFEE